MTNAMMLLVTMDVPSSADHLEVIDKLHDNMASGMGCTITMPDGYQFDVVLGRIETTHLGHKGRRL